MPKQVAFLRAINVGGHTVKMARLRGIFADMGFAQVETYIASGNVIFETQFTDRRTLERTIEGHLREVLSYDVATFIRSISELEGIVGYEPFPGAGRRRDEATLYIGFVAEPPNQAAIDGLRAFATETDAFHVHGSEVYWLCSTRMSDSKFSGALLEKTLGMAATLRNANTVRKILAKYDGS